jgi:DNA polymerase-3 subunit alpha/error-prone DNA polymerase
MVLKAKQLGYKGLALCDINGLYGVVRGFQAAEKPSAFDTEQLAQSSLEDGSPQGDFRYHCGAELTPYDSSPIVLLPMNKDGYVRLCHLITLAKRRAPKGHIALGLRDIIAENEDLIALPLPPWKEAGLKALQEAFQDRIYIPVYKDFTWESIRYYRHALKIEQEMGIPAFATQRPLFHHPDRKPLHDVLTCILHRTTLDQAATRLSLNRERHLKSLMDLKFLFRERPDLLARTNEIAARLHFHLSELRYHYPREYLPPGKTAPEFLRELVETGLQWRYPTSTPPEFLRQVRRQVEHELSLIHEMEYEDYFLTLWDICQFARSKGILHQGRGSAANSIVCFVLGLTSVDPVKLNLLFERFISRERGEPPDIDIDFEHERREEVIQYIYQKYGERRAAMVCTVITYRSRMALREVAKVMGLENAQVDALIKFMGREGLKRLVDQNGQGPGNVAKYGLSEDRFQLLLKLALEIQGFPRHLGIHSGGFVISHEPIIDIVPVESATMNGRFVIQWNKDDINILGLMKIDVLSLGMLSALRKALDLLREKKNIDWNLAQIPHEDAPTYEMIARADTIGVFQIESRAQMSILPRLKPKTWYDLVISVAIVRPGPIQGGMVHPFLNRRAGRERVSYAHPSLVPILKKTLGIPLFQEQVMQIAVVAAGFTPGEADELRRIMSSAWKKQKIMDGLRQRVVSGMLSHGLKREYAEQIYKTIEGFSSYGFPESHAASFALLTYASCYLKRHHPDVFACALLNSQPMGFYSPRQLIADAQRHGVKFFALDIQHSHWEYTLEDTDDESSGFHSTDKARQEDGLALKTHGIRTGLCSLYGLKEEHIQTLVTERDQNGRFRDIKDLIERVRFPRAVLIRLAASGALSSLGYSVRETLWRIQGLCFDPQSLLFGQAISENSFELEALPKENDWQSVQREYLTKGFSIDSHPLAVLRPWLNELSNKTPNTASTVGSERRTPSAYTMAKDLSSLRHRTPVKVAGLMSLLQKPPTAKGMCFISLEDETGLMNLIVTPDLYQKYRMILLHSPLLEAEGWLENRDGVRHIRLRDIRPLLLHGPVNSKSPEACSEPARVPPKGAAGIDGDDGRDEPGTSPEPGTRLEPASFSAAASVLLRPERRYCSKYPINSASAARRSETTTPPWPAPFVAARTTPLSASRTTFDFTFIFLSMRARSLLILGSMPTLNMNSRVFIAPFK